MIRCTRGFASNESFFHTRLGADHYFDCAYSNDAVRVHFITHRSSFHLPAHMRLDTHTHTGTGTPYLSSLSTWQKLSKAFACDASAPLFISIHFNSLFFFFACFSSRATDGCGSSNGTHTYTRSLQPKIRYHFTFSRAFTINLRFTIIIFTYPRAGTFGSSHVLSPTHT